MPSKHFAFTNSNVEIEVLMVIMKTLVFWNVTHLVRCK
jgi:hypothetical protein